MSVEKVRVKWFRVGETLRFWSGASGSTVRGLGPEDEAPGETSGVRATEPAVASVIVDDASEHATVRVPDDAKKTTRYAGGAGPVRATLWGNPFVFVKEAPPRDDPPFTPERSAWAQSVLMAAVAGVVAAVVCAAFMVLQALVRGA